MYLKSESVRYTISYTRNRHFRLALKKIDPPKRSVVSNQPTQNTKMAKGYICCFSNLSMPGILKISMTEGTPEARLNEANASDTWRPPTPYRIEFAKKVSNPLEKRRTLHTLLEQYTERINTCQEFFRTSPEEVRKFFDLMDGKMWAEVVPKAIRKEAKTVRRRNVLGSQASEASSVTSVTLKTDSCDISCCCFCCYNGKVSKGESLGNAAGSRGGRGGKGTGESKEVSDAAEAARLLEKSAAMVKEIKEEFIAVRRRSRVNTEEKGITNLERLLIWNKFQGSDVAAEKGIHDEYSAMWRAAAHEAVPYSDDLPEWFLVRPELNRGGNDLCDGTKELVRIIEQAREADAGDSTTDQDNICLRTSNPTE
jgi:hypothetical protein